MVRLAALVGLLGLIGCGHPKEIQLTIIVGDAVTSDAITKITSLEIAVLGDEPGGARYGIAGELTDRKTTWIYRSKIDGNFEFDVVCRDVDGNIIASGKSQLVKTKMAPVSAKVTLGTDPPNPNKSRLGQSCTAGVDVCASGFCVDGVCCNSACTGECSTCNGITPGTCAPASAGTNPRNGCTADTKNACGLDGTCDGAGACRKTPVGRVCAQPSCTDGKFTSTAECDGMGTCVTPAAVDCTPYACNPMGNGCATVCECASTTTCTGSAQCAATATCTNGSCGHVGLGAFCATTADCTMGTCVDNTCCDSATCSGSCQSCREPGHEGHCTSTAENNADPHDICKDTGSTSCGATGKCDGKGACQKYAAGTQCAVGGCNSDGSAFIAAATCVGDGSACPAPVATRCAPYKCVTDGAPGCGVNCGECVYYDESMAPPFQSECVGGATCANNCLGTPGTWTCM